MGASVIKGADRTRGEWALRIALALAGLGFGSLGFLHSYAQTLRTRDPSRAHIAAPWDGRLTASLAQKRLADDASPEAQPETIRLAQRALRQDTTAVAAVVTLGWQTQARGDLAGARRLFRYSEFLSRRDLQTQLWAIEDAVRRGDVRGAMRHYDLALRTNDQASDVLFPVLTAAIAQSEVRDALVETLRKRPPWGEYFVSSAMVNGSDPRANLLLMNQLDRAGWHVPARASSSLVNALVSAGAADPAWSYYARIRGAPERRMSRDPGFSARLDPPSMLDWVVADGDASGAIQGGTFDFAAPTGVGGRVLQQSQLLPPGAYRIEGRSSGIDQPAPLLPYWLLACPDGRELGRVVVPSSKIAGGAFRGAFTVPANCPVQTLALVVRGSDALSGVTGQILHVQLVPVAEKR